MHVAWVMWCFGRNLPEELRDLKPAAKHKKDDDRPDLEESSLILSDSD
jgi:hypothetical protein